MSEFDRLLGRWRGTGEIPIQPPMAIEVEASVERLGTFLIFRSSAVRGEVPDSVSIIGGGPDGEPQPMHYFDERGIQRRYLTTLAGMRWTIWLAPGEDWNGRDGPGFNQRFIGQISDDGLVIDGRWERGLGPAGDRWELDFPLRYVRA